MKCSEEKDDRQVPNEKEKKNFVEKGNKCNKDGKFQEAAFWYFQEEWSTNGSKFNKALQKAGKEYNGFDEFLEQFHARREIDAATTWRRAKELWENREDIKSIFKRSLIPISVINSVRQKCCRILGIKKDEDITTATGFLAEYIGEKFILTNHHALNHPGIPFVAEFEPLSPGGEPTYTMLNCNFVTNQSLDVGIASYNSEEIKKRDHFDLNHLGNASSSDAMVILQHPRGLPLHESIGVILEKMENEIDYTASTDTGSSGSFVLGVDWKPIALHFCGLTIKTAEGKSTAVNRGTKFEPITKWMTMNSEKILKRLKETNFQQANIYNIERTIDGTDYILMKNIEAMQYSVCQIFTREYTSSGSGFLATYKGIKFILTHNNILYGSPQNFRAHFGYYDNKKEGIDVPLTETIQVNKNLNVTLCGYNSKEIERRYHFDLSNLGSDSKFFYGKGDSCTIFHRPQKDLSHYSTIHQSIGIIKSQVGSEIYYDASADVGSEGSIVLSAEWKPLAFHHAEMSNELLNCGIMLSAVRQWIQEDKIMDKIFKVDDLDEVDKYIVKKLRSKRVPIHIISKKLNRTKGLIESLIKSEKIMDLNELDKEDRFLIKTLQAKNRSIEHIAKKLQKPDPLIRMYLNSDEKDLSIDIGALDSDDRFLIRKLRSKNRPLTHIAEKLNHDQELIQAFLDYDAKQQHIDIPGLDENDQYIIDAMNEHQETNYDTIANKLGKSMELIKKYMDEKEKYN